MDDKKTPESEFLARIIKVLGKERTSALSDRQDRILSQAYKRLLDRKPLDMITDEEIKGQYEMVIEHLSPLAYEVYDRDEK